MILGSGTVLTSTLWVPSQQTAFIEFSLLINF
jgi:hypothetical protein